MIAMKKAISRRTVLRGIGTAVALPLLDAMVPALTAQVNTPAKPIRRLGVVYHPNGVIYDKWLPTGIGTNFELSPVLKGLEPFKDQTIVVYCQSGGRSLMAVGMLRLQGFDAKNLSGGIKAWKARIGT